MNKSKNRERRRRYNNDPVYRFFYDFWLAFLQRGKIYKILAGNKRFVKVASRALWETNGELENITINQMWDKEDWKEKLKFIKNWAIEKKVVVLVKGDFIHIVNSRHMLDDGMCLSRDYILYVPEKKLEEVLNTYLAKINKVI